MEPRKPSRPPITGRGAAGNPKNRFEKIEVEPDYAELDPEEPKPETTFYRDHSRSIIARNDSPDVGFEASVNPYRGCEHGCVYCLSGDTPILMADGTTRRLEEVGVGDEVYGTVRCGAYRRYTKTRVSAHWGVRKPAYRVTLADGTALVAGGDHRFLTERGWKFVTGVACGQRPYLTTDNKLMGTGAFASPPARDGDYKRGYLCGIIRGDGHLASYEYRREGRAHGNQHRFRLALTDRDALRRTSEFLLDLGVAPREFVFQEALAGRRTMRAIRTSALGRAERIRKVVAWQSGSSESWCKGFLAGIFDAEGGYGGGALRIFNTDPKIVERVVDCLKRFGFAYVIEHTGEEQAKPVRVVRLTGGMREHFRFFHTVDPAITRKRSIEGRALKNAADLRVVAIEPLGSMPLFDITTGTGDFIANGVVSHNCYARPTHEYLGLSAGLDFETKVLVKERAPELLREQLSSPRWEPRTLSISGVTDPYQPVERKLRLTRRCIEVLAEFRNPLAIVTKNHLVTRDTDLLRELARHDAVCVAVSLTTLDGELRRVMEPRTSSPSRRLAAIEKLAEAGIPVGVMTAPVIPGLTDHELPRLISAAADAGAGFAAYTVVRLPHAVAPLFEDWLERNFPARKEKVLNRLREMRGGELYDPRYGTRMRGEGLYAGHIARLFRLSCRRAGIGEGRFPGLSTAAFRRSGGIQPRLFD